MITRLITIDSENIDKESLKDPAREIRNGGLVAFATETVYGLGADANNEEAVKNIYITKGRPSDNPMIVHIADAESVTEIAKEVSEETKLLMEKFSPGPITYILKKKENINKTVTAGLDTVAVRIPSHPVAREFIRLSGCPIAAPSANLSGKPSPTKAEHVMEDMNGKIPYIIDGGMCEIGLESTVIDMTGDRPVILRPGGITIEMIREYIPSAIMNTEIQDKEIPKSPGMKYKHYSPDAEVIVVEGSRKDGVIEKIASLCRETENKKIGVILRSCTDINIKADFILYAGETGEKYGANLFDLLRKCDQNKADIVFAELERTDGVGMALRNRIYKSAANNVIRV